MTIQAENTPTTFEPPAQIFDERVFVQLSALARAVNRTHGRMVLYGLAVSIVVVVIATAAMQVRLNAWNQPFYDAIQTKAFGAFVHQLLVFFVIAGVLLVLNVTQTGLNQAIRLKLRELATKDLIENWMTEKRAARISRAGAIGVNPDQRIQADAEHLTEITTGLGIGLLQASLLLVSFIGVLWGLSRGIVLHFNGQDFAIPGYLVWAALLYALSGSLVSWRVGRPLVRLTTTRYAREADFRHSLVRGAEQADGIALDADEADERHQLVSDLANVLAVSWQMVWATIRLTVVTAGYGWVGLVVPIIVAAPGYFGGQLSFGDLMMTVGAFNQVQQSLRWFVDNTGIIADWRATMLRVMNFRQALLDLDHFTTGIERFERVTNSDGNVTFDDLVVINPRGQTALGEKHVEVRPGERVLFVGEPGAGKSTFFLSIAGLWDWGSGRISLPPAPDMMFLAQRPFVPAGTLRGVLTHADDTNHHTDEELGAALQRVGLGHLTQSLDRVERCDTELSMREQQRLALGRLLLNRPKWVVSDEALDLTEDSNREIVKSIFENELADTAIISIGSSSHTNGFYARCIKLVPVSTVDRQQGEIGKPA
jgi:putative ATP-binding cassette transporter